MPNCDSPGRFFYPILTLTTDYYIITLGLKTGPDHVRCTFYNYDMKVHRCGCQKKRKSCEKRKATLGDSDFENLPLSETFVMVISCVSAVLEYVMWICYKILYYDLQYHSSQYLPWSENFVRTVAPIPFCYLSWNFTCRCIMR